MTRTIKKTDIEIEINTDTDNACFINQVKSKTSAHHSHIQSSFCSSSTECLLDDSLENSVTVDMIVSSSINGSQEDEDRIELQVQDHDPNQTPSIIPTVVSFESPRRRRRSDDDDDDDDGGDANVNMNMKISPDDNDSLSSTGITDIDVDSNLSHHFNSDIDKSEYICAKSNLSSTGLEQHSSNTIIETIECTNNSSTCEERKTFNKFRLQYLIVHSAIMLADGLQGTHLYVLYEGYGYSVSSLYSLGFISGAFTSPFIGPVVDKIGRKRAAMIYCILEVVINYFEQHPIFIGLILSRVLGGITTNLLFSVFESWLVTEHRTRGFEDEKLEIILRDSTIVSNSAAIISGYLAHCLAAKFGPVGPFEGAVAFTAVALVFVWCMWSENYGSSRELVSKESQTWQGNMIGAYRTIVANKNISRIGTIQGLTEGALQTFVFLWAPALRAYATTASKGSWGLGSDGEPAYGLIFGSFMAFGVIGGFSEPTIRKMVNSFLSLGNLQNGKVDPVSVHFLCALCYLISSTLLLTPCIVSVDNQYAFSLCFAAFLAYELLVGLYMPCEGIVRSIYMPNESICSLMTMLRVIVNIAVAGGVISTNFIPFTFAFGALSMMMVTAACLQLSLVPFDQLMDVFQMKGIKEKKNKQE